MAILDGKQLAQTIKAELRTEVDKIKEQGGKLPHLVAVLVGENPASQAYVRNKVRSCEEVGFQSTLIHRPADISEQELLEIVEQLNHDISVDGFIVQLPLPRHIDEHKITLAIEPKKDVDGFHPVNFGRMAQGLPCYLPATPMGILEILRRYEIPTAGKEVVVLGRSNIVGTPISVLLSRKGYPGDATVTVCHSRTEDLAAHTRQADILIAAIGVPEFVKGDMVKKGAVVIDVGINRVEDPASKTGYKLVGDVDYAAVAPLASWITPVPGGVGQLTVVALLINTLKSARGEIYGLS
ncbi:MAG TPA: bifunctional methylenetetrahydrofolate dehydrogenase/methenyltetrahydrofolate cyclohydrolase FolD [Haliscomenobacter sp.]|uniref:bifunctional methylenetetrahydrofolate dehydrogenase/methenyltetrahydrofolate cyclohydrolase FolD n=1 Tax=Haliscomenobacter sp. TaxID=2717303 RepID=UPI002B68E30A|nr:bifunctional methylenetetrahydrofolate dehydrogenase/methenyltetrahydrofolate cyclohydrolase FolD [Haliscomenobacter sp.]HOY18293.1 bifunctional methylenetetrahydrofolate dehydrogenase/methenyltetrahydrofolate cyclohydrolase FolD [Haliscomenobacter sp.]HPH18450.1 bifunctional methylenetetrahydrofolate dehydrogenase/methenyltetrahydrofolate cyclohydrolase FolD [Haliscomenobacter sp.]